MSRKFVSFWLLIIPDVILLYTSLFLAIHIRYTATLPYGDLVAHIKGFSVIFAAWLFIFYIHGLFEAQSFRRYTTLIFNLVSAMAINILVAITYFYFQPNLILTPRRFLLLVTGLAFVGLTLWHLLVKYVLKKSFTEGLYLFSFNNGLDELEREINGQSYMGFKVLGHLNEQNLSATTIAKDAGVILPDTMQTNPGVIQALYQLRTLGVRFYNYQDFYENLLRRIYLSQLSEVWFLENINYREKLFYIIIKRVIDIFAGIILFLIFIITYPILAGIIKIDSQGPALFSQKRVGKNGKVFLIYKYRSMNTVTDTTWTKVNDTRITKAGKILRKIRADELPQSINLVLGDISLVGPRPEQLNIVEQLRKEIPFYDERHLVKPGITGWSQLNIYASSLEESKQKLQFDLYYIKHRGFLLDLEIILKTIYYIFAWKGR